MRHELDMHGQASSFLAEGMTDHSRIDAFDWGHLAASPI